MVLKGHKKGISEVKFSPDGQYIASGSADMTVRIWEASTGINTHIMEGHLAGISAIAWSPDSQTVASGSDDKTIRLWDRIEGDAYPKVLKGHSSYVYSISFSPKGNMIVSGAYDEAVFLWDARTGRQMKNFPAHSDPVAGVDFTRDGTLVASCGTDGLM
jgi:COMPASS component SWD3